MIPLARRVRRMFAAGYDEASQEQRSCSERTARGMARAVAYLIEQTGDARWAHQRAEAMIHPRHPYGACDPVAAGIERPADGEQGDEGIAPTAWAIAFFKGDTSCWDEAWAKLFRTPSRGWG